MGATLNTLWRYTPLLICLAIWELLATGPISNALLPDVLSVAKALWACFSTAS